LRKIYQPIIRPGSLAIEYFECDFAKKTERVRPSCENFEKYFRPLTAKQFGSPVIKTVPKVSFDHSEFRAIHPGSPRYRKLVRAIPDAISLARMTRSRLLASIAPDRFDRFDRFARRRIVRGRHSHFQDGDVKIAAAITTLAMRTRCFALAIAR